MSIRIKFEIEDKQVSSLVLWLNEREGLSLDDKLSLLDRARHWLNLTDPIQHGVSEIFSNITMDVDGQPLQVSALSGKRFQSEQASPSLAELQAKALEPKASRLPAS